MRLPLGSGRLPRRSARRHCYLGEQPRVRRRGLASEWFSTASRFLAKWLPQVDLKFEDSLLPVGMAEFEPAASCSQISPTQPPDVA